MKVASLLIVLLKLFERGGIPPGLFLELLGGDLVALVSEDVLQVFCALRDRHGRVLFGKRLCGFCLRGCQVVVSKLFHDVARLARLRLRKMRLMMDVLCVL